MSALSRVLVIDSWVESLFTRLTHKVRVNHVRPLHACIIGKLSEWKQVYQQQEMATSLEKMVDRSGRLAPAAPSGSMAEEVSKLKTLHESGAITKEEYEKANKKLLG